MKKVTLTIENSAESRQIRLEDETSFGRTNLAQEILADSGLSRLNTTIFRDGDEVLVVDENSLNGTFVNGEKISGKPKILSDGDEIKIGSETRIRVEIKEDFYAEAQNNKFTNNADDFRIGNIQNGENAERPNAFTVQNPETGIENPDSGKPPFILILAGLSAFVIVFLGLIVYLVASRYEGNVATKTGKSTRQINKSDLIPVRVVDTLGVEDEEILDDLIASWEVQDADFEAKDLEAVAVSTDAPQLAVPVADWEKQRSLAMGNRNAPVGAVSGVMIPQELQGGIRRQLAYFAQVGITRETLPRDYISLAQKRMNNELIELPLATETYYLDNIGTSADSSPFSVFDIDTNAKSPLTPEGFSVLQRLAGNYNGTVYDLNNPSHRKLMKQRLLRMFHPEAKLVLEEIAGAYYKQFKRPLKVTSLTRSLEYQVALSRATANAYKGPTPPHSTGRTFDIAYMHMTAEEQNFLMAKFAELARAKRIDSLHERGQTPCIHTFVFPQNSGNLEKVGKRINKTS
jgi:pSer/pThr/pTyr-binding forkhead associated (FHA) protein